MRQLFIWDNMNETKNDWVVWNEERTKRYIETYGPPDNPKREYKKRMLFISQYVTGNTVLDVGCGAGHLYPHIAPNVKTYKGIDISADMLNYARKFFPRGDFEVGNVYDLTHEHEYDTIVSASLIIHIPLSDVETVIKQMWHRTLKELVFTTTLTYDHSYLEGGELATHLSPQTLNNILRMLDNIEGIRKTRFEEGVFGYNHNDFVVVVTKLNRKV